MRKRSVRRRHRRVKKSQRGKGRPIFPNVQNLGWGIKDKLAAHATTELTKAAKKSISELGKHGVGAVKRLFNRKKKKSPVKGVERRETKTVSFVPQRPYDAI